MYTVVCQIVHTDGPDEIYREENFNTIDECNEYLNQLHSKFYSDYDTKLLNGHSLFLYKWNGKEYTKRIYFKII